MSKRSARDRLILYAIGISTVVLAIGFSLAWFYMQRQDKLSREIAYMSLPRVAISRDGHSIAATFAIKTSALDAEWAKKNQVALEAVMKQALLEADPVKSRGPAGLQDLQSKLKDSTNVTLQTTRVQEVLVTDFLVSEGDL